MLRYCSPMFYKTEKVKINKSWGQVSLFEKRNVRDKYTFFNLYSLTLQILKLDQNWAVAHWSSQPKFCLKHAGPGQRANGYVKYCAILSGYIFCLKRAGLTLHLVVQTGLYNIMHSQYSCTGTDYATFRVWRVHGARPAWRYEKTLVPVRILDNWRDNNF